MAVAPYGSWPSPISSAALVERAVSLSDVRVDGSGAVWWNERRPQDGGRQVVVRDGVDVLPDPFSARSRVHEYGGAAYAVGPDGTLFFVNDADQRVWRLGPTALTPDDGARYADLQVTPDGAWVVAVREKGDVNDLVAVPAGGGAPVVLAAGRDFYAAPRLSPDGSRLAWLCWDHPDMPWDGTELWTATWGEDAGRVPGLRGPNAVPGLRGPNAVPGLRGPNAVPGLRGPNAVAGLRGPNAVAGLRGPNAGAGGAGESVSQPRWSPDGTLHWISDRTGWWNLYREPGEPLAPMAAEFSQPDWVFGQSTYAFLSGGRLAATWSEGGRDRLGLVEGGAARSVDAAPFTNFSSLQPGPAPNEIVAIAGSPEAAAAVVAVDPATGALRVVKASRPSIPPAAALSRPRPIEFPTAGGRTAHAFFYPPRLEGYEGPPGERPPLVVKSHGGPTSAASTALNLEIQYWTSRGLAVVDVDYGGSSGYGRDYRRRLEGQWGVVDVDDVVNAALHLAATGEVDRQRMVVRGGSAGGYTTLCALTFRPGVFAAGASYYGVADLETLARDTHKFESRYLDRLVGPYPGARDVYRERSPIHAADRIAVPVILFQGLEDRVVPPSQAEVLVDALRRNRVPFAYVTFEGEQHGFRRAETIRRAIEAELWFYGQVLGFEPADDIEPVAIENYRTSTRQRTSNVL